MSDTVITSVCMNRNAFLRVSVPEWLKLNMPIVVVDWSSAIPVRETLGEILREHGDRISIVEVPGKKFFDLSRSKNLSYRAVRHLHPAARNTLSFDCDVYVTRPAEFRRKYPSEARTFYTGGRVATLSDRIRLRKAVPESEKTRIRNRLGTFGTFLCPLTLLEAVNMNDERMTGYGAFDKDLYRRLSLNGGRRGRIAYSDLLHQDHAERSVNYAEKDMEVSRAANHGIMNGPVLWDKSFPQEKQTVVINGEYLVL
jgi:hypothetical protein